MRGQLAITSTTPYIEPNELWGKSIDSVDLALKPLRTGGGTGPTTTLA